MTLVKKEGVADEWLCAASKVQRHCPLVELNSSSNPSDKVLSNWHVVVWFRRICVRVDVHVGGIGGDKESPCLKSH